MSLIDIFSIIGLAFICVQIVKFLNSNTKQNEIQIIQVDSLSLEKINNVYYAYLGNKFVGQNNSIDNLVLNMRDIYNVKLFNYDKMEELSEEENNLVKQSIEKWYITV